MDTEIRWHLVKGSRGDGASVSSVVAETVTNDAQAGAHTHVSSSRTGAGWERHWTETHLQNPACQEGTDYSAARCRGREDPRTEEDSEKEAGKIMGI